MLVATQERSTAPADLRGLNPFCGRRTPLPIDTRRAVQTGQGDRFDLSFVPQILVERDGTQPVSPAALNDSCGYLDERLRYEQTVLGYNTSGNIFDGIGAGPFSMAVGIEWRQEVGHNHEVSYPANVAACQARIQGFAARFGTPCRGRVAMEEGLLATPMMA